MSCKGAGRKAECSGLEPSSAMDTCVPSDQFTWCSMPDSGRCISCQRANFSPYISFLIYESMNMSDSVKSPFSSCTVSRHTYITNFYSGWSAFRTFVSLFHCRHSDSTCKGEFFVEEFSFSQI